MFDFRNLERFHEIKSIDQSDSSTSNDCWYIFSVFMFVFIVFEFIIIELFEFENDFIEKLKFLEFYILTEIIISYSFRTTLLLDISNNFSFLQYLYKTYVALHAICSNNSILYFSICLKLSFQCQNQINQFIWRVWIFIAKMKIQIVRFKRNDQWNFWT